MTVLALAAAPLLLSSPTADAHERHAKHYDYYQGHHRGHMPRWLQKHHSFSTWYWHSGLRANLRLGWDELFSIYRWEVRYSGQHRAHRYDRGHGREFHYYRGYWNDRHHSRERHRYGDRKRGKSKRHEGKRDKRRH